jgi:SAM-dependent methyltransferase
VNWFHRQVCRSDNWRVRISAELLPWTLQGVELGEDLLEIGPGPGVTTDLLRTRKGRLTALEVDSTAFDLLRQRLSGTDVRVVHGDGAAMPFPNGSFSGVVAFTMLHHVPTAELQDRLFSESLRVLSPGGVFAGFDGVGSLAFRLIHLNDTYTPVNPETLGYRLKAAGFKEVAVERQRGRFRFQATRP